MNAMFRDNFMLVSHSTNAMFSSSNPPPPKKRVLFTACQVPRTPVMVLHIIYLNHFGVTETCSIYVFMPSRATCHVSWVYLPFLTRNRAPVCGGRGWSPLRPGPSNTASLDSHQGASEIDACHEGEFRIERIRAETIHRCKSVSGWINTDVSKSIRFSIG